MKEIIITKDNAGGRLDKIVAKYLDKAPKSFVYKMLRKKNIVLNDKKAAGNELLKAGDSIKLYLADETVEKFQSRSDQLKTASEKAALDKGNGHKSNSAHKRTKILPTEWIAYEDENIIAVNKPAGVLSQQSRAGEESLNEMLVAYLSQKQDEQKENPADEPSSNVPFKPGISNRLDRNTSGLVIAGKTLYATRELNKAIKERRLQKFYLCIVDGVLSEGETLDGYLVKDEKTNKVSVFREATMKQGGLDSPRDAIQPSGFDQADRIITKYEPVKALDEATLLEVDLITGKSHQIRAHLASIAHPIIGDVKYGKKEVNAEYRKRFETKRQLLHAYRIAFHGMEGALAYLNGKEIKTPISADFAAILDHSTKD